MKYIIYSTWLFFKVVLVTIIIVLIIITESQTLRVNKRIIMLKMTWQVVDLGGGGFRRSRAVSVQAEELQNECGDCLQPGWMGGAVYPVYSFGGLALMIQPPSPWACRCSGLHQVSSTQFQTTALIINATHKTEKSHKISAFGGRMWVQLIRITVVGIPGSSILKHDDVCNNSGEKRRPAH